MVFVGFYLLGVVDCVSCVVCNMLYVARWLLLAASNLLVAVCCLMYVVRGCASYVICGLLFAVCSLLRCCVLVAVRLW